MESKVGLSTITNEVRGILLADEKLTAMVGDRIYPLKSQGNKGDFILYAVDGDKEDRNKMGITQRVTNLLVKAVSTEYTSIQKVYDCVCDALVGEYTNPRMSIEKVDSTDDLIDDKYVKLMVFEIKW